MTGRRGVGGIRGALLYPCPMDAKAHDLQEIPWRYGRVIRSGRPAAVVRTEHAETGLF